MSHVRHKESFKLEFMFTTADMIVICDTVTREQCVFIDKHHLLGHLTE